MTHLKLLNFQGGGDRVTGWEGGGGRVGGWQEGGGRVGGWDGGEQQVGYILPQHIQQMHQPIARRPITGKVIAWEDANLYFELLYHYS